MNNPIIASFTSKPGCGKNILGFYPHERLGESILHICTEPIRSQLTGIPKEWVEGRVETVTPGMRSTGGRFEGEEYYNAMKKHARQSFNKDTIILNTATGVAKNRYSDKMMDQKGEPTKYRKENECAQQLIFQYVNHLMENNPESNILVFHHRKAIWESKGDMREIVDYAPELIGTKIDESWGGRFGGILYLDRIKGAPKPQKGGPPILSERFKAYLRPTKDASFVFMRHKPGLDIPSVIDFTIEKEGDYTPLKACWDGIFEVVDSAG